jgi:hypothetical protein
MLLGLCALWESIYEYVCLLFSTFPLFLTVNLIAKIFKI